MGRKKKDQDSEANKVIIISFFLANHILITSYSSGFKQQILATANKEDGSEEGGVFQNSTRSKTTLWGDRLFFYEVKIRFTKVLFQNSLKINGFFTLCYTVLKS